MEYYRSDPESADLMWRAECASVERFCQGVGIDPGAGGRTLDANTVTMDLYAPAQHRGDARSIPFPDGHFDFVFNAHLVEHLPDPRAAIREWLRVVKPGGHVAMVIPNTIFTCGQNTDQSPHLWEWSPREFAQDVLGVELRAEQPWTKAIGRTLDWCDGVVAHAGPACERWSFSVVLKKLEAAEGAT